MWQDFPENEKPKFMVEIDNELPRTNRIINAFNKWIEVEARIMHLTKFDVLNIIEAYIEKG